VPLSIIWPLAGQAVRRAPRTSSGASRDQVRYIILELTSTPSK
jgi:hypothetical protein